MNQHKNKEIDGYTGLGTALLGSPYISDPWSPSKGDSPQQIGTGWLELADQEM
jgi:hypothetical protein